MKIFTPLDFAGIIKEATVETNDSEKAAKLAHSKASRIAGLMTDQSYSVPTIGAFKDFIEEEYLANIPTATSAIKI